MPHVAPNRRHPPDRLDSQDVRQQPEAELIVGLREIPSENAMEAGLIFPAPGQEEAWFKANHERLTELGLN
jgi:hypothetical protein